VKTRLPAHLLPRSKPPDRCERNRCTPVKNGQGHLQYYETFAAFQRAILECLRETQGKHKDQLATLLTLHFQVVKNETS